MAEILESALAESGDGAEIEVEAVVAVSVEYRRAVLKRLDYFINRSIDIPPCHNSHPAHPPRS